MNLRIRERKVLKNLRNKLTRKNLVLVVGIPELLPPPPSPRKDKSKSPVKSTGSGSGKNGKRDKSHDNSSNLDSADLNRPDVYQDGDKQISLNDVMSFLQVMKSDQSKTEKRFKSVVK